MTMRASRLRPPSRNDAVGATQILGNELPGLVAKDTQMLCGDIGIVDDDVVVIAAADPRPGAAIRKRAAISR